jgi:hypothetical protein
MTDEPLSEATVEAVAREICRIDGVDPDEVLSGTLETVRGVWRLRTGEARELIRGHLLRAAVRRMLDGER